MCYSPFLPKPLSTMQITHDRSNVVGADSISCGDVADTQNHGEWPSMRNDNGYYRRMAQQTKVVRSRRRGQTLENALYEATLNELAAAGYGGLTMEGIAARARTGKAALYRRWPSKRALVQAALLHALPPLPEPRSDRSARENLLTVFTAHCDVLAGKTAFPGMDIIGQLVHEPELRAIFADAVVAPRLRIIESILRTGERNGEIDPANLTP